MRYLLITIAIISCGFFLILTSCGSGGGGNTSAPGVDSLGQDVSSDSWVPGQDTIPGQDWIPGQDTILGDVECDCGDWICGTTPQGCFCGTCPGGEACAAGTCVPETVQGTLGTFCGATPACPATIVNSDTGETEFNPGFQACVNGQCDSGVCLGAVAGIYLDIPACIQACEISLDEVNNKTGMPGPDGVEDPDTVITDCVGFSNGPGGADYVCVNFSSPGDAPLAYCIPGSTFHHCAADADCVPVEQCAFTTIAGEYASRCITRIQDTPEVTAAPMTESCDTQSTPGPLTYCESGWCFGLGCVSYCSDDTHCDTTKLFPGTGCDTGSGTCKGWPAQSCTQDIDCSHWECGLLDTVIFENVPGYTADLCWPKSGCQGDVDCPDGTYCQWNWNGEVDPLTGLPTWANICVDKTDGGVPLGGACAEDGPTCENGSFCLGGHCSALCDSDGDCAGEQLCVVTEFNVDLDGDGADDQSLPLKWCMTFEGSLTPCFSNATCGTGERCELHEVESLVGDLQNPGSMILDTDGPYLAKGLCVTADTSLAAYGESCYWADDCMSGWCLGADPGMSQTGFCTGLCEGAADCGPVGTGENSYPGVCNGYLYTYGGDSGVIETNIHLGLCGFTSGSGADCSANLLCPGGEACFARPITYGPDYSPNEEYVCLSTENLDGSLPTKTIGQACDPWAEDSSGNSLTECIEGICFEDVQSGTGYCSRVCKPEADDCSEGGPSMKCLGLTTVPRKGKYTANSATWFACRKDIECTPCYQSGTCPGDRVCVNLGQDNNILADFRCVQACTSNAQCVGAGAATCNIGTDGYGQPAQGCFDMLGYPVNHCN
ncbi:MAG: hypothetical protein ABIK09_05325 [Pseudomonadota bacterium]